MTPLSVLTPVSFLFRKQRIFCSDVKRSHSCAIPSPLSGDFATAPNCTIPNVVAGETEARGLEHGFMDRIGDDPGDAPGFGHVHGLIDGADDGWGGSF